MMMATTAGLHGIFGLKQRSIEPSLASKEDVRSHHCGFGG
jgi:hypothetical protein